MSNLLAFLFLFIFGFFIYLALQLFQKGPNAFFDKLTKKTLWLWLPFYGLWRLVREVFFDKR